MFTLIELPYAMEALEPVISAQTLSFHHGKHLQAYVAKMKSINMGDDKKEKLMIVHGEHKDDVWLLGTSVKDMGRKRCDK